MATDVSICSNALVMLGAAPIASFTEGTTAARVASNLYPDIKRAFLRAHPWNAAITRVQLAPLSAGPAFGRSRSFLLPSDCVRVLSVEFGGMDIEHKIEGRNILADSSVVDLRYVTSLAEDLWDSSMVEAMTLRMAAAMAYAITKSAALAEAWGGTADRKMREAKTLDGQEGTPDAIEDDPFMRSRYPGGGF
jgi:hypothetical protein